MLTSDCQILVPNFDGIPDEMRYEARWVLWKAVPKKKKNGTEYRDKEPRKAVAPTRCASSTNSTTWAEFNVAREAYQRYRGDGMTDGIGFVLGEDWLGIDLDDVLDSDNKLLPAAAAIVATLDSYTEVSPSGKGLKIFLRGTVPGSRKNLADGLNVEIYPSDRYFTVTGCQWPGAATSVATADGERLAEVMRLWNQLDTKAGKKKAAAQPAKSPAISTKAASVAADGVSDDELIDVAHRVCRGFPALWAGQSGDDESADDMALANHLSWMCGPNEEARVRRLMEKSGLKREKWEREDYLPRTIAKAYETARGSYNWPAHHRKEATAAASVATIKAIPADGHAQPCSLLVPSTHDDVGLARRLAKEAAGVLRFVSEWKKWVAWDGKRWREDDGGAAMNAGKRLRDGLWNELRDIDLPNQQQAALFRFIQSVGSAKRLAAIASLASSEPALRVDVKQLNTHPMLLNLHNGTLDLNTLKLLPHNPDHLITQLANVAYEEDAHAPEWEQFIRSATGGDEELAKFLQRSAGAALTGSVRDEKLWCHYGDGGAGKSTFLDALRMLLGDYACTAPDNFLAMRSNNAHPTELATLHGKRLVTAIEMEAGVRMRESLVKSLTGGDAILARRMREDFWTIEPTWKIHVSFNDPPRVSSTDGGIRRRLLIVPWTQDFKGKRGDAKVKETLTKQTTKETRAGILAWAIAGLQAWKSEGIGEPDVVMSSTDAFNSAQDTLGQFIDEHCLQRGQVEFRLFNRLFTEWLDERGEHQWTANRLSSELSRRGFHSRRASGGSDRNKTFYQGISLLSGDTMP